MAMKINNQVLNEAVAKTVRKVLSEKKYIQDTLNVMIEDIVASEMNLLTEKRKHKQSKSEKDSKDKEDSKGTKNAKNQKKKPKKNDIKKHAVLRWLQQDTVNTAEIRRRLEGEPETQEEEDAKRSYFMKKVNQSHGKDFTSKEINDLYSIKGSLGQ